MNTYKVNGFPITNFSSLDSCADYILKNPKIYISLGAEGILNKSDNFKVLKYNQDCVFFCDGYGSVLALNKIYNIKATKIPGCELWLKVIEKSRSSKIALIGGSEETNSCTESKLISELSANIVYRHNGFFSPEQNCNVIESILASKPDIVFIAMGQPRQEEIAIALKKMDSKLTILPIGGSFDVYTGKVNRAPKLFINLKIEWLYRLIKQPSRWQRQLVIPKFIYLLFSKKINSNDEL